MEGEDAASCEGEMTKMADVLVVYRWSRYCTVHSCSSTLSPLLPLLPHLPLLLPPLFKGTDVRSTAAGATRTRPATPRTAVQASVGEATPVLGNHGKGRFCREIIRICGGNMCELERHSQAAPNLGQEMEERNFQPGNTNLVTIS